MINEELNNELSRLKQIEKDDLQTIKIKKEIQKIKSDRYSRSILGKLIKIIEKLFNKF